MPITAKQTRIMKKFSKRDLKISKKFFPYLEKPGDLKLYVLAQNGREKIWTILGEIDAWGVEFNTYWNKTQFKISTTRADFGKDENETLYQIITRASHIAKGNGELYSINDGTGIQAFHFEFAYNVMGILEANSIFDLDDAEMES